MLRDLPSRGDLGSVPSVGIILAVIDERLIGTEWAASSRSLEQDQRFCLTTEELRGAHRGRRGDKH